MKFFCKHDLQSKVRENCYTNNIDEVMCPFAYGFEFFLIVMHVYIKLGFEHFGICI